MLEQHGSSRSTRSSRLARQSRTCRVESSRAKWNLGLWDRLSVYVCNVREPWLNGSTDRDEIWRTYSYGPSTHCVTLTQFPYAYKSYVCQTVRWVLATRMERGRQRPSQISAHIQSYKLYCLKGDASWRAGRYWAWWVGNIVLSR